MSKVTIGTNTGQQLTVKTDLAKIFVWNNRYEDADYTNSGYDTVDLLAGTLMGRVSATQKVIPHVSTASDGSQFPVGILAEDRSVEEGDTVSLSICVSGDVAEEQVILGGSDTMATVISDRSIRDRIAADTVGVKLVGGTEMTAYDND